MIKKILVPVDGSEHSLKALVLACDMADKYQSGIHLLHIPEDTSYGKTMVLGGAVVRMPATEEEIKEAGESVINAARDVAREKGCKHITTELNDGDPAKRIIESAEQNSIDMIVMGCRGLSDLKGLLVGSVSHKVSHLAHCTCVTVR